MNKIICSLIIIFSFCCSNVVCQEYSAVLKNSKGEIFKTHNSGKSWSKVLPDNLTAVLIRSNGEKLITNNTGKSWKLLSKESIPNTEYSISVTPNPATDNITIDLLENSKNSEIIIVSLLGEIMHRQEMNNSSTLMLDIKSFPDGIYFVKIMQDNIFLGLSKVIKSR